MKINIRYLLAFIVIIVIEICIALFVHDTIIRPYIGDVLVIILMYTFIKAFIKRPIKLLPLYLFAFSLAVELAQYFKVLNMLNLQDNRFLAIIMGTTFDIKDVLCYLIGSVILLVWEKIMNTKRTF